MQIVPYLMFNGEGRDVIRFYEAALGAQPVMVSYFKDTPQAPPGTNGDDVMHATLQLDGATIMLSDSGGGHRVTAGDNVQLSLDFSDADSQQRAFDALAEGGTVTMPLADTFWGARFGMLTDKFGIRWMFNWDRPKDA